MGIFRWLFGRNRQEQHTEIKVESQGKNNNLFQNILDIKEDLGEIKANTSLSSYRLDTLEKRVDKLENKIWSEGKRIKNKRY